MALFKYRPTPLGWAFLVGLAGIIAAVVFAFSGGSDSKASANKPAAGSPTADTRLVLGDGPSRATPTLPAGTTPGTTASATTTAATGDGAIAIASPAPPPDPGIAFAFPLQSWLSIGDRFGVSRGAGYMHGGIDLNVDADATTTLYAVCTGSFVGAAQSNNYGSYFVIDCGNQWTAVYAMVGSTNLHVQQPVAAGDPVGDIGPAKDAGGAHLHFELRYHGYPVNPEAYMQFGATAGVAPTPTPAPTNAPATASPTATKTPKPAPRATSTPPSIGGAPDPSAPPPQATDTPVPAPTATSTPTPWEPTPTATATPPPTETVAPTRTPLPPRRSPTPAPISD